MNLKGFHLIFIAFASALAFLFGAWALRNESLSEAARVAAAVTAFAVGVGLIAYETWFLKYSRSPR